MDNGDAMNILGAHNVLDHELADLMRRAVGFRNVLVHEYVAVDDSLVVARLGQLGDLEAFVSQVAEYVEGETT